MADMTVPSSDLRISVYNKKYQKWFGTLTNCGWFSAAPDDVSVNRAIRTNNPGAINDVGWEHQKVGYIGKTKPDSVGNITAIYQTPEHGVSAWYFLLADRYDLNKAGKFDLHAVARMYAGADAKQSDVDAYLAGWLRWSGGALQKNSIISLSSDDDMLKFAKAEFAHEAAASSPLNDDQIRKGLDLGRKDVAPLIS